MKKKLGLYIHIPFCQSKCLYCDFLSAKGNDEIQRAYVEQLVSEIRAQGSNYADYQVSSIFIGGGTPSLLKGVYIVNIMSAIYENFVVEGASENTIECNPGTLDEEKLLYYKQSGINRISVGLQSAINKELKYLGRIHSYEDFLDSFQKIRYTGFTNVNVDLMSGIPWQTMDSWNTSLKKVAMLKPEHISAYSLIIEEGTEFQRLYGTPEGRKFLPSEGTERAMYHVTKQQLEKSSYSRYEISNYAKPGFESKHNTAYWTGQDYLGMGLGAYSFAFGRRFHVERDLRKYLEIDMSRDIQPLYQDIQELGKKELMEEFMFLGLRMMQGVSRTEFLDRFDENMFHIFEQPIKKHLDNGLLTYEKPYIKLTDKGIDLSNMVMSDFLL